MALDGIGWHWVALDGTGWHWMAMDGTEWHWVALGDTGQHIGDKAQERKVVRMTSESLDSKWQAVVAAN